MEKKITKNETAEYRANKTIKACKAISKVCFGLTRAEAFGCLETVKMILFSNV